MIRLRKKPGVFLVLFGLFLSLALVGGFWIFSQRKSLKVDLSPKPYALLAGQRFYLQIADNDQTRAKGLSGQENFGEREAMLFVFPNVGRYPFWMNEMKFGLDFIFVNGQKVVDLVENVPPPQPGEAPQSVRSKVVFDKVLEVNQGTVKDLGLQTGDQLEFFLTSE